MFKTNVNDLPRFISECGCRSTDKGLPTNEYWKLDDIRTWLFDDWGFIYLKGHNHDQSKVICSTEHCDLVEEFTPIRFSEWLNEYK